MPVLHEAVKKGVLKLRLAGVRTQVDPVFPSCEHREGCREGSQCFPMGGPQYIYNYNPQDFH